MKKERNRRRRNKKSDLAKSKRRKREKYYCSFLIEIAKYTNEEQDLAGIVIYVENKKVNKALDGLTFHS
jgi:hypothetical protein